MPKTASGLDKQNWSDIENLLRQVFENTNIQINVFTLNNIETYANSVIAEKDTDSHTQHSDDEAPINGLHYKDIPINFGKNQIIFKETTLKSIVEIKKMFGHEK